MNRNRKLIIVIIAALAVLAGYQNYRSEPPTVVKASETAPKRNAYAPSFTLDGMNGQAYSVGGKRDKLLLVNFWASWCDPCKEEAPDLVNLYNKHHDILDVYAVNSTSYDKLDNAKAFVKKYKFKFPVLTDPKGKATDMYNILAFPTSFLIDRNGIIREVMLGMVQPKQLERKIKELAAEPLQQEPSS